MMSMQISPHQSERLLGKGHTHKFLYEEFPIKIVCIIGKKMDKAKRAISIYLDDHKHDCSIYHQGYVHITLMASV